MAKGHRDILDVTLVVAKESFRSFMRNNGPGTSASLAYYGFFAFIPLAFIVIAFVSTYIVSSQVALKGIEGLVARIFPQFSAVLTNEIHFLLEHKNTIGILGFVALFWSITPLSDAVRSTFQRIFKVDKKRPFLKSTLLDMLAVSVMLILFGVLMFSELLYDYLEEIRYGDYPFIFDFIDILGPFVLTFLFVLFFYLMFLPVKLKTSQLCIGAGITAILWTLIREIFSAFITYNPSVGFAFGSMKAIFVLILWSFLSFAVLIFGMEILANIRRKDTVILQALFDKNRSKSTKTQRLLEYFIMEYHEGEVLFSEGDKGERMFYVVSGLINIVKNGMLINTIKPTEYFGEMAMLLNIPRTASAVIAAPDTQLIVISRKNFETMLHDNPEIVMTILKSMAARLRSADEHYCATN
jgi:YihY family inner membrane protein